MKKDNKIAGVNDIPFSYHENHYISKGVRYKVTELIEVSKGLPVISIPIQSIYIGGSAWNIDNFKTFIFHMQRVENSDLKYPILLDDEGYICDGWHRVAKAIMEGKTKIKAKRLTLMPEGEILTE